MYKIIIAMQFFFALFFRKRETAYALWHYRVIFIGQALGIAL